MGRMKRLIPWLLAILYVVAPPALAADASSCYAVPDADARAYCLAKAHGDPSRCYSIQDSGLRSQCFAEVRR
jgi:hypothetical protein